MVTCRNHDVEKRRACLCSIVDALNETATDFRNIMRKHPFYKNPYLDPKNASSFNLKDYDKNRKIVEERAEELCGKFCSSEFDNRTFTVYFDVEAHKVYNSRIMEACKKEKLRELELAEIKNREYHDKIDYIFGLLEENPSHWPEHYKDVAAMALTALDDKTYGKYISSFLKNYKTKNLGELKEAMCDAWLFHDSANTAFAADKSCHAEPGRIIYDKLSCEFIKRGKTTEKKAGLIGEIIENHNMPYVSVLEIKNPELRAAIECGRTADKRPGLLGPLKITEDVIVNSPLQGLPDAMYRKLEKRITEMERFLKVQKQYPELSKAIYGETKEFELKLMGRFGAIKT